MFRPSILLKLMAVAAWLTPNIASATANGDTREQHSMKIHMVVVADNNFQSKYEALFERMESFANRHEYLWHIIGSSEDDSCHQKFKEFFFRKHCMVADWAGRKTNPGDKIFVFDADVVPFRPQTPLDYWLEMSEDLIFYDRTWNNEIMAGNYMIRNVPRALAFLNEWAQYEYKRPPGFSSADNGAIHLHLAETLFRNSESDTTKTDLDICSLKYQNLTESLENLDPYFSYVGCTREIVPAGSYSIDDLSIRIAKKNTAWVMDGVYDSYDGHQVESEASLPLPIFHHGVKMNNFEEDSWKYVKYNLTIPVSKDEKTKEDEDEDNVRAEEAIEADDDMHLELDEGTIRAHQMLHQKRHEEAIEANQMLHQKKIKEEEGTDLKLDEETTQAYRIVNQKRHEERFEANQMLHQNRQEGTESTLFRRLSFAARAFKKKSSKKEAQQPKSVKKTESPSGGPSSLPSSWPSESPSESPSGAPSQSPSGAPSSMPSVATMAPTTTPTATTTTITPTTATTTTTTTTSTTTSTITTTTTSTTTTTTTMNDDCDCASFQCPAHSISNVETLLNTTCSASGCCKCSCSAFQLAGLCTCNHSPNWMSDVNKTDTIPDGACAREKCCACQSFFLNPNICNDAKCKGPENVRRTRRLGSSLYTTADLFKNPLEEAKSSVVTPIFQNIRKLVPQIWSPPHIAGSDFVTADGSSSTDSAIDTAVGIFTETSSDKEGRSSGLEPSNEDVVKHLAEHKQLHQEALMQHQLRSPLKKRSSAPKALAPQIWSPPHTARSDFVTADGSSSTDSAIDTAVEIFTETSSDKEGRSSGLELSNEDVVKHLAEHKRLHQEALMQHQLRSPLKKRSGPRPVSCGNHKANSCDGCPQGHGRDWCHGDCKWILEENTCIQGPRYIPDEYEDLIALDLYPFQPVRDENGNLINIMLIRSPLNFMQRLTFDHYKEKIVFLGIMSYETFPLPSPNPFATNNNFDDDMYVGNPWIQGWLNMYRNPRDIFDPNTPIVQISQSDFALPEIEFDQEVNDGKHEKRYDFVYSMSTGGHPFNEECTGWGPEAKNWTFAKEALEVMCGELNLLGVLLVTRDQWDSKPCKIPKSCDGKIVQTPFLDQNEAMSYFRQSRFLFVPQVNDASPRVITQALSLNVPVLMNKNIVGGWKYINNQTGEFFNDLSDFKEAYWHLEANIDLEHYKPREYVVQNYGNQNAGKRFFDFVNENFAGKVQLPEDSEMLIPS